MSVHVYYNHMDSIIFIIANLNINFNFYNWLMHLT